MAETTALFYYSIFSPKRVMISRSDSDRLRFVKKLIDSVYNNCSQEIRENLMRGISFLVFLFS